MDDESADCSPVGDRINQLDFYRFSRQRLEELLIPAAGTIAIGSGNRLRGLADRAAVTTLVGSMNLVALSSQLSSSDAGLIESIQQIVKVSRDSLELPGSFQYAATDALPAAIPHHLTGGGFADLLFQVDHQAPNPLCFQGRSRKRIIGCASLQ
jgi:hypothetical protein